jgi:uncharacterized protein (DUF3084 family)
MRIPTSLILISVLVILACVIAYVSDNMGKKLGKKRISLLGMRPRQTATALTMASSVGIMFVTLLVVSLFSRQVRTALLRVDKMRENNEVLRDRNRVLKASAANLNTQLATLKQSVEASRETARESNTKAQQASQKADKARQKLSATQGELTSAQSDLRAAQSAVEQARRGEKAARGQVQAARSRLSQAQQRYAQAQGRFAQAQQRFKQAQSRAEKADRDVDEKQRQLQQASRDVQQERDRLTRARNELTQARNNLARVQNNLTRVQGSVNKTVKELGETVLELEQNRASVNRLREQVELEQARLETLKAYTEQLVTGRVVATLGQVFAERIIPAGLGPSALRDEIRALIEDATEAVRQPPINAKSVGLVTRTVIVEGKRVDVNEQEIVDLLTGYMATFNVPVAVRWAAARNYVEGETEILGLLLPVPVRTAFPRGTTLAETKIAGAQSDARIFNQLLALVNSGEKAAREQGITPPLTPQVPNFYADGTNERIFEALRQVQSHDGPSVCAW